MSRIPLKFTEVSLSELWIEHIQLIEGVRS